MMVSMAVAAAAQAIPVELTAAPDPRNLEDGPPSPEERQIGLPSR